MSRLRSAKFRRPLEISEADLAMPSGDRGPNLLPNYADWSSLADDELYRVQLRHRLVAALIELPPIYRFPRPATRCPGAVDGRGQCHPEAEAPDPQVSAAPWAFDSARATE